MTDNARKARGTMAAVVFALAISSAALCWAGMPPGYWRVMFVLYGFLALWGLIVGIAELRGWI